MPLFVRDFYFQESPRKPNKEQQQNRQHKRMSKIRYETKKMKT